MPKAIATVTITGLSIDNLQLCRRALRQYGLDLRSRFVGPEDAPLWVEAELQKVLALMKAMHAELMANVAAQEREANHELRVFAGE